jgi:hypothetical protein
MKTLVIHPVDDSTEFLREIYANISCTVVRQRTSKHELNELMKSHDRIIGLGHGSPAGLFGWWGVDQASFSIGASNAPVLQNKENIYIWCHADQFVKRHHLAGFSSGMFISEVDEASMYDINASRSNVEISNYAFAYTLGRALASGNPTPKGLFEIVTKEYLDESDPVVTFNSKRMIYEEIRKTDDRNVQKKVSPGLSSHLI